MKVIAQFSQFVRAVRQISATVFYRNPRILVESELEIAENLGLCISGPCIDVYNFMPEALGQKIVWSDDHVPDIDRSQPLIATTKDLSKICEPDFATAGRLPMITEIYGLFQQVNDRITLNFVAPFTTAMNIRGMEQFIMDIYMQPEFAKELLDRLTNITIAWVKHLQSMFSSEFAIGSDAMASLPIVNLDILENWVVPYNLRIVKECNAGVNVPNWTGEKYLKSQEDLDRMFELKHQVCPDFMEGQDPDTEILGPEMYLRYAEKYNVPLILGIGAEFLKRASLREVIEKAQLYADTEERNTRGASLYLCDIAPGTPKENRETEAKIRAIVKIAENVK